MCCNARGRLSRLGVLSGVVALSALLAAFLGQAWLYTKEPVTLPNSQVGTSINFRIGLWKVCHQVKKVNGTSIQLPSADLDHSDHSYAKTQNDVEESIMENDSTMQLVEISDSIHPATLSQLEETISEPILNYRDVPSPSCLMVKYSGWENIGNADIGVWTALDFAQVFISRMRSCTILCGAAVVLIVLALLFALIGHCNNDNKTIIACGLFILGGLSLGAGLVIFASSLSETLMEIQQYHKEPPSGPVYDYRYGWCFFTAGIAFIITNMAAVFSISGYLNRFSSTDEMVRQMVPGAERKLREHQLSTEYLVHHAAPSPSQYDALPPERPKYEPECGPLLNKTPPDVCTTNKCPEFSSEDLDQACVMSNLVDTNYSVAQTLAGQTVPITIKNFNSAAPLSFSNLPIKYGTMHFDHPRSHCPESLHQGFLGIADLGSSSSTSSSGYCGKSKTLQHPKNRRKCTNVETFQVPETSFQDFSGKRTNDFSFSGSAV